MRQQESILLTRWLATFHRDAPQWKRVRLGIPANPQEAKMYSVLMRWADAVFLEEGVVNIVETKLRPTLGAIGQLEGYKDLFKVTPEFKQFWNWPIKLILVSPIMDLAIGQITSKKNIEYDVWTPEEWR